MNHDKWKSAFKFIHLVYLFNLFPLEVEQKFQHCQLCVLPENSSDPANSTNIMQTVKFLNLFVSTAAVMTVNLIVLNIWYLEWT